MAMMGARRLRVVFDDASLLSESQRRQGLQRCWFQLWPDLSTIADLSSQLHKTFDIRRSCPHGLVISMDGFVLPPFESTCILKDEDIIMINRNGVIFKDVVKFCGSQNPEHVLQSKETSSSKIWSLASMDTPVNSEGHEHDMVLCNGSAVHILTTSSDKMNPQCKRKHFNIIQGSDNTLISKDYHKYEEDTCLHGNMAHKESTSNEMVKKKRKKKHTHKLQTSVSPEISDLQLASDKGHFILPIPHGETSTEMIQAKKKKKYFDKLQGSNDTLAVKEFHGNSQRDEQGVGHHVNTAHKEATSVEMMNSKYKRKCSNKLEASVALTSYNSEVVSQGDTEDLVIPNGGKSHQEIPSCELTNAKRERKRSNKHRGLSKSHEEIPSCKLTNTKLKKKHSNRHVGSDDILAVKDSYGDSKVHEEDAGAHGNIDHNETTINEMNTKRKKSCSNKHYTSDNTLAAVNFQGDVLEDDEDVDLSRGNLTPTVTTKEMTDVIKKKRSNQLEASEIVSKETDAEHESKTNDNGDAKRVQSRSAGRKKAKRRWHRIHGSKNNLIEIELPQSHNREEPSGHANDDQNSNLDKHNVPFIVRPGHIRFETSDDSSDPEGELMETLQWNRTTCKRKGQNWGSEKSYNKRNDGTSNKLFNGESDGKKAEEVEVSNEKSVVEVETYKESFAEEVEPVSECEYSIHKELKAVKQLMDYESFLHLNRLPEESDILIYRVVELSSSWSPELSPFRVGRVSSYDLSSSKIILLPLPEYPLIFDEMLEEGQEINSLYKEDGTLEIDFPLLLDVRLFKDVESEETPIPPVEEMQNSIPVSNHGSEGCSHHTVDVQQLSEGWEAINRAIDEKKAQLKKKNNSDIKNSGESTVMRLEALNHVIDEKMAHLQKNNNFDKRNSNQSNATGPWSYKALRRNALGPTLAMLRSGDGELS